MKDTIFKGRTIAVVDDLSLDEQIYLYDMTARLKSIVSKGGDTSDFRLDDSSLSAYLIFLEDSTRTKESFRNAINFHNIKLNPFEAKSSSFNKKESYADTLKMLCGYSEYSIFIIRSQLEGVCRWLEHTIGEFAERNNIAHPAFINAGDGKHEHPTQEFLDEFSFYEQKNWSRDHIHIALIGDLYHGRTVHSKVNGLRIFREVEVDLIAPDELAMPAFYTDKMLNNGFRVRRFSGLEEYLSQEKRANIWYFTRLQLERMGEDIIEKANKLRKSVTFQREYMDRVSEGTRFYHPLPRHREHPTVPVFLDSTSLNGWERQSINGYYTRVVEIAMLGGKLGHDFSGESPREYKEDAVFIEEVPAVPHKQKEYDVGFIPIPDGTVIDHIGKGDTIETIWEHINHIRRMLDLNTMGSHGVYESLKDSKYKGMVALPGFTEFHGAKLKKLAAIAPGCTLNIIEDRRVVHKYRLSMPPSIYNFDEISCKNSECISYPTHAESAIPFFDRAGDNMFACRYCQRPHTFREIWAL